MFKGRSITLRHLLIDGRKHIGLQFKSDKVVQALVEKLPGISWNEEYGMYHIENNKNNIGVLFNTFRGEVWINGNYFFENSIGLNEEKPKNIWWYRTRDLKKDFKRCPDEYLDKLELRKYAENTVKTYVHHFETFINHYPNLRPDAITEKEIRDYLQKLSREGRSSSYLNQAVNSIKFYYEVVKGMPNRFYGIERPIQQKQLPKVLSKSEILSLIKNTNNLKHHCIASRNSQ